MLFCECNTNKTFYKPYSFVDVGLQSCREPQEEKAIKFSYSGCSKPLYQPKASPPLASVDSSPVTEYQFGMSNKSF